MKKIASGKRNNVKEKKNEEESSINYGGSINGCESWGRVHRQQVVLMGLRVQKVKIT